MSVIFDACFGLARSAVMVPDVPGARTAGNSAIGRMRLPSEPIGSAAMTFTGLPAGCDVVVLLAGTSMVLLSVDSHPGTSYAYQYNYGADSLPNVDVGFIKPGYLPFYIRNLARPKVNSSIPVALSADRNYS